MISVATYLAFEKVYPDEEISLEEFINLVSTLNTRDTLKLCANINWNFYNLGMDIQQESLVDLFFAPETAQRIKFILDDSTSIQFLFFRGQLLEIIRWVVNFGQTDSQNSSYSFANEEIRYNFGRIALIARSHSIYNSLNDNSSEFHLKNPAAIASMRQSMSDASPAIDLKAKLGRARLILEKYFSKHYKRLLNKDFPQEFQNITEISIQQYYDCLFAIYAFYYKKDEIISPEISLDGNSIAQIAPDLAIPFEKYLNIKSQSIAELKSSLQLDALTSIDQIPFFDRKSIRNKPIIRLNYNNLIVIDPLFFIETLSSGILFLLVQNQPHNISNIVFSAFGCAFEDYVHDLINQTNLNGEVYYQLQAKMSDGNSVEFCDLFIKTSRRSIVAEIKGVFIPDKNVAKENYMEYLFKKYTKKGFFQLSTQLINLARQEIFLQEADLMNIKKFTPIIIAHDSLLTTPGHAISFTDRFKEDFQADKERFIYMKKGDIEVTPLVIIPIGVVEIMQGSQEIIDLEKIFSNYQNYRIHRTGQEQSFGHFWEMNYRNKFSYGKSIVIQATLEALEVWGKRLDL